VGRLAGKGHSKGVRKSPLPGPSQICQGYKPDTAYRAEALFRTLGLICCPIVLSRIPSFRSSGFLESVQQNCQIVGTGTFSNGHEAYLHTSKPKEYFAPLFITSHQSELLGLVVDSVGSTYDRVGTYF